MPPGLTVWQLEGVFLVAGMSILKRGRTKSMVASEAIHWSFSLVTTFLCHDIIMSNFYKAFYAEDDRKI